MLVPGQILLKEKTFCRSALGLYPVSLPVSAETHSRVVYCPFSLFIVMSVHHVHACPRWSDEGFRFCGDGVIDVFYLSLGVQQTHLVLKRAISQ